MIEAFISRHESKVNATGNAIMMAAETCQIAETIFRQLRKYDEATAALYLASVAKGMGLVCDRALEEKNEDRT